MWKSLSSILFFSSLLSFSFFNRTIAQDTEGVTTVMAKKWSKDDNNKVQYSDWKPFEATTISALKDFTPVKNIPVDGYGGFTAFKKNKTGYFRTEKINDRWWVIDPDGHPFYVMAVNSVRTAKSSPLPAKYKDDKDWINKTIPELQAIGFNSIGSWSEVALIAPYNQSSSRPMAYTTQLSLLSGYTSEVKKQDPSRKGQSPLSFILDENFPIYCNEKCKTLTATAEDKNLLGHFSDNEIAFTSNEAKDILKDKIEDDKAYQFFVSYCEKQKWNMDDLSKEQQQQIIGAIAGVYYSTVANAIKKADPHHLYLGSRLHSNAKNNAYVMKEAAKYADIISINYYGDWEPKQSYIDNWASWSDKPFFITEFYTKAEETGMSNKSGAGWIVKTQTDRGIHYQNFCLTLLKAKNCVGWHWFRYQDNDPNDSKADDSNKDSNKGMVNIEYEYYQALIEKMKELNLQVLPLVRYFDDKKQ